MEQAKGIDVSHWNVVHDFGAIPADVQMIGIKGTEGDDITDRMLAYHRDGARARGFTLVKYFHIARPGDPAAHVARLSHLVGPLLPGECLVLDSERSSGVGVDYIEGFYAALENQGLATPHDIWYGSRGSWPGGPWPRAAAGKVALWAPRYKSGGAPPTLPAPWKGWAIWQWTDGGKTGEPYSCPGVGPCDASVFNGDQLALQAFVNPPGSYSNRLG